MKRFVFFSLLALSIFVYSAVYSAASASTDDLPYVVVKHVTDFSQLAAEARSEDKIVMLMVSASDCEYCELLEEEFLKPMLRNDDYDNVLIRKIDRDSYHEIKDFAGEETNPGDFSRSLKVKLTPTLLFFDGNGNEISQRILGINSLDLYGGYLDAALRSGLQKIKLQ